MQKRIMILGLVLLIGAIGLACAANTQAQLNNSTEGWTKTPAQVTGSDYKISGPYAHKNLTVFLIHGDNTATGKVPLTLQEAMALKKVKVIETGDVNQLAIQNISDEEVFVQSGDIVKGGQQDRVLAMDLLVPPRSGRVPIDSFCVEHGRWQQRGEEMATAFSSSEQSLNHKDLKIAAKQAKSQNDVWAKVEESQVKLGRNAMAAASPPAGVAGMATADGSMTAAMRMPSTVDVTSATSRSSLQLTLENKVVKETADEYLKVLQKIIAGKNDVIGYAFAINGQINSADVYSSHALFAKLWPKMLKASAIEAISEFDKSGKSEEVSTASIKTFLNEAENGKAESRELTPHVMMVKSESEKNLFFETRDRQRNDEWLHRNYLKK
jgi:hypothetical protein